MFANSLKDQFIRSFLNLQYKYLYKTLNMYTGMFKTTQKTN